MKEGFIHHKLDGVHLAFTLNLPKVTDVHLEALLLQGTTDTLSMIDGNATERLSSYRLSVIVVVDSKHCICRSGV